MKLIRIAGIVWPTFRFNFFYAMVSIVFVLTLAIAPHHETIDGKTIMTIVLVFSLAAFLLCLAHALITKSEKIIAILGK